MHGLVDNFVLFHDKEKINRSPGVVNAESNCTKTMEVALFTFKMLQSQVGLIVGLGIILGLGMSRLRYAEVSLNIGKSDSLNVGTTVLFKFPNLQRSSQLFVS